MDTVEVLYQPQDAQETAQKLLAAAGDDQEVVRSVSGGFVVPVDVAARAGYHASDSDVVDADTTGNTPTDTDGGNGTDGGNDSTGTDVGNSGGDPAEAARTSELTADEVTTAANADRQTDDQPDEPLRGKALDDALIAADLSTGGVVAEKQARLAEYQARQAAQAQL